MAYMNQERKAIIAANIKPILEKYRVKASLSVRDHLTIVLTVKKGEIDFIGDYESTTDCKLESGSMHINQYWFKDHFSGAAKAFLAEVYTAMRSAGWYNNSDASVDYFDTAYYMDVNIGVWRKPYILDV